MKQVYENGFVARNNTEQENLLKSFGLHLTEVSHIALHLSYSNMIAEFLLVAFAFGSLPQLYLRCSPLR